MPELRADHLAVRKFASRQAEMHVIILHVKELLGWGASQAVPAMAGYRRMPPAKCDTKQTLRVRS